MTKRWVIGIFLLAASGVSMFWSVRVAYADYLARLDTPASLERASQLMPTNADYLTREAILIDALNPVVTLPDERLRRALELNPRLSEAWMAQGLRSEMHGNSAQGEKELLEAARVDGTFKPAWTLANFYLRQGNAEKFWPMAQRCLRLVEPHRDDSAGYDAEPIFDLCWRLSDSVPTIQALAIPQHAFVHLAYVGYLINQAKPDAAIAAWNAFRSGSGEPKSGHLSPENLLTVLGYVDFLIAQARPAEAMSAWNSAIEQGLLVGDALAPEKERSLTNGSLSRQPLDRGFDWRLPLAPSLTTKYFESEALLRFELNGDEDEHLELAWQAVPLIPGRNYSLNFKYRTEGASAGNTQTYNPAAGLHWSALNLRSQSDVFKSNEWSAGSLSFAADPHTRLARLSLRYDRVNGTTRFKGTLSVRDLSLVFVR